MKRQLLRGMVDENIETITGQPLGTLRRARLRRRAAVRRAFLIATVTVAVVGVAGAAWYASIHDLDQAELGVSTLAVDGATRAQRATRMASVEQLTRALSTQNPQQLVRQALPLHVRRVAVDPGHGGRDGGTSLKFGILEKDITRDVANRLQSRLETAGMEVVITRSDDDSVSLKERAEIANQAQADLFVSIHVNWLPNRNARGVETYYLGTTDDPFLNRLAAAENQDSGFAMTDLQDLLTGIYADVRQAESRQLAESIQEALFGNLREANENIVSRGVMTAPFVVLVATDMPAILAEVACLSNANEARLLAIPEYRQRIADALFDGVINYSRAISQSTEVQETGKGNEDEQGKL